MDKRVRVEVHEALEHALIPPMLVHIFGSDANELSSHLMEHRGKKDGPRKTSRFPQGEVTVWNDSESETLPGWKLIFEGPAVTAKKILAEIVTLYREEGRNFSCSVRNGQPERTTTVGEALQELERLAW
jgi:hypothetical protein